jgi:hypothetical protein
MVDLLPEGSVSLPDFFERFSSWMWRDSAPFEDLDFEHRIERLPGERIIAHRAARSAVVDATLREAVGLFQKGAVQALALFPGEATARSISPRAWIDAFFPERMFLSSTINPGHGDEFDAALGRTLYTEARWVDDVLRSAGKRRREMDASAGLRDCILGLAMDGVLPNGEAEKFAAKWGLAPLARRPPPDKFEPHRSAFWTLPMAVTWIVWRDDDMVREQMAEYRSDWWEWFGFFARLPVDGGKQWYEVDGVELRTLDPPSLSDLMLHEALDRTTRPEVLGTSVKSAREELWTRLSNGSLVATGIDAAGQVVQVPAHEWPYIVLTSDDRLRDQLVFKHAMGKVAYREVTLREIDLVKAWPPLPKSGRVTLFDYQATRWSLLVAAIWVGCKGQELTSQQIADEDLEEKGAYELFRFFLDGELVATGLNRQHVRETIPAEYWELATLDPNLFRKRHYVSFIDDILEEEGGQFTPYGESSPRWFGIKVETAKLLAAFPEFAPAPAPVPVVEPVEANSPRLAVAQDAIASLYPGGVPKGLARKDLLAAVNAWLRKQGHSAVSPRTLSRAISSK